MKILLANTTEHPMQAEAFDLASWAIVDPVVQGGRGSAWFVGNQSPDWVLREYRRGGLPGKAVKRLFFYTGRSRVRAVRELDLLEKLYGMGLPVPMPIAAAYRRIGLFFYHAWIIVSRIDGARTLASIAIDLSDKQLKLAGETIRRFHDHGLDHADLNCNNVLLTNNGAYLIDFDKCRFRDNADIAWKNRNLRRLKRSLYKECTDTNGERIEKAWSALLAGYARQPGM